MRTEIGHVGIVAELVDDGLDELLEVLLVGVEEGGGGRVHVRRRSRVRMWWEESPD